MKIIHIIDYFQPKLGYQEFFLAKEHEKLGHDVFIVTSDRYNPDLYVTSGNNKVLGKRINYCGFFYEEKLHVWRLRVLFELNQIVWMIGLRRKIMDLHPDFVIVHAIPTIAAVRMAVLKGKLKNFKLIYDSHTTFYNSKSRLYPIFKFLFSRIILDNADAFVAVVPEAKQFMVKKYGIPENRIKLIPLGADHDRFIFSESARKSVRMKLNIKDSEIMFIYTGKITPSKNIKILFEALNYLKNKGNGNFRMAIIGEGPDSYIKELKDFAQIHGIDDFILWHDMVLNKDLAPYYSAADVGVWPREASATILEAMSCNLPIILSDFSKVTFLVSHDNGYLFKDGNAIDLSGKMELLLKNELRIQMGKNSRKIIEEKYNWTIIAKKFLDL